MQVTLTKEPKQIEQRALELLRMADGECTLAEAIEKHHIDFLRNITVSFRVEWISQYAIDAFQRHYRVPCVIKRNTGIDNLLMVMPDTVYDCADGEGQSMRKPYEQMIQQARDMYQTLVQHGVPERDASYVLPNAVTCSAEITMSLAELLDFFSVECCSKSHWENRKMADEMLVRCKEIAPNIFDQAGPPCVRFACHASCGKSRREEWDEA